MSNIFDIRLGSFSLSSRVLFSFALLGSHAVEGRLARTCNPVVGAASPSGCAVGPPAAQLKLLEPFFDLGRNMGPFGVLGQWRSG